MARQGSASKDDPRLRLLRAFAAGPSPAHPRTAQVPGEHRIDTVSADDVDDRAQGRRPLLERGDVLCQTACRRQGFAVATARDPVNAGEAGRERQRRGPGDGDGDGEACSLAAEPPCGLIITTAEINYA